jgi:hypothetical protein
MIRMTNDPLQSARFPCKNIWVILEHHLAYFMAIWYILRPFGIVYGHLVYYTAIWYIIRPFGILYGHLEYFAPFWYIVPRKIWQP